MKERRSQRGGRGAAVRYAGLALAGLASLAAAAPAPADNATPASCWHLGSVPGPEDLLVDRSQGEPRLLVSSQDRRARPQPEGAIYALPLAADSTSGPRRLRLAGRDGCSFHPHGISLVQRAETGRWLLYVINHHQPGDTSPSRGCLPGGERLARHGQAFTSVEVYRVERHRLRFLQRLADPEIMRNGNDLVALDDGDIFVTSPPAGLLDRAREAMESNTASEIIQIECRAPLEDDRCPDPVFSSLTTIGRYVNGIEARDRPAGGRFVYVASTLEDVLYELKVDPWRGKRMLEVETGLDNLAWKTDEKRVLLAAGHSDMRRFLQHAWSPEVPSPSGAWEITLRPELSVRELLTDEGSRISAASSAVCFDGDLILGQVFESAVLRCHGSCR